MKTKLILPSIVLGAGLLGLSASVVAAKYTDTRPVGPIAGFFNATDKVVIGVGHAAVGVVGGVVKGTEYVATDVAHTTAGLVHHASYKPTHVMNKPVHKATHKVHHKTMHKMAHKTTKTMGKDQAKTMGKDQAKTMKQS